MEERGSMEKNGDKTSKEEFKSSRRLGLGVRPTQLSGSERVYGTVTLSSDLVTLPISLNICAE